MGVSYGDSLDFEVGVEEKLVGADECSCGVGWLEVLRVDAVEGCEG